MSSGKPIKERRKNPCGDNCVKDDFSTVKKLVFTILVACVLNVSGAVWVVYASADKNGEQDSRITAIETDQKNIIKNQEDQKVLTRQLITLTTQTNLLVQTHIARSDDQ